MALTIIGIILEKRKIEFTQIPNKQHVKLHHKVLTALEILPSGLIKLIHTVVCLVVGEL